MKSDLDLLEQSLDLLEQLLSVTEPYKDSFDQPDRDKWLEISAKAADLRDGEPDGEPLPPTKYTIGTKRRLLVEQIDHDEHDHDRRTPVGTIVEITDIYDTGTPYQVCDPVGGGWWLFTAEELDHETEAVQ